MESPMLALVLDVGALGAGSGAGSLAVGGAGASASGACASARAGQIDSKINTMMAVRDIRIMVVAATFNSNDSSACDCAKFVGIAKVPVSQ
jgi:hypothetical protein